MTASARAIFGRLDALLLLVLAWLIVYLVSRDLYWFLINPRFEPVSLAAAGVFGVLGLYGLIRPANPAPHRSLALGLILVLGAISAIHATDLAALLPPDQILPRQALEETSRLERKGVEFIKINTGELYAIAEAKNQDKGPLEARYAVRGFVHRDPGLDAKGRFGLYRTALYCCFADMTSVGFVVQAPENTPLPDKGVWVLALGRLWPLKQGRSIPKPQVEGSVNTATAPRHVFVAEELRPVEPPASPHMLEWRESEPYAF